MAGLEAVLVSPTVTPDGCRFITWSAIGGVSQNQLKYPGGIVEAFMVLDHPPGSLCFYGNSIDLRHFRP
jgi:hypothetical protein